MKKLSGGVRTALAQYRELASFSQFASDLDDATKAQLASGQRITELLKQKQYAPMSVAQQSISLFAADRGFMDDVEIEKIGSFESALHAYLTVEYSDLENSINETGDWNDEIEKQFTKILPRKANFSFEIYPGRRSQNLENIHHPRAILILDQLPRFFIALRNKGRRQMKSQFIITFKLLI